MKLSYNALEKLDYNQPGIQSYKKKMHDVGSFALQNTIMCCSNSKVDKITGTLDKSTTSFSDLYIF